MANNFPFDRTIQLSNTAQSSDVLTITGQFITEAFIRPTASEPYNAIATELEICANNPQLLKADYLLRFELEQMSDQIFHLLYKKKRSLDEILKAAQILQEDIWANWSESSEFLETEHEQASNYFTGSQSELIGPASYRTWSIFSDPSEAHALAPDDWFEQKIWGVETPWTWPEIYAIFSLWMIDESAVYLNLNNPYKSSVWLLRANQYLRFAWSDDNDSLDDAKKHLARLGGQGKREKYKPLKEFLMERVKLKNYPSRRNAAYSLAPEVIQKAKELGFNLSEQQAPITIARWLKEHGFPANI